MCFYEESYPGCWLKLINCVYNMLLIRDDLPGYFLVYACFDHNTYFQITYTTAKNESGSSHKHSFYVTNTLLGQIK